MPNTSYTGKENYNFQSRQEVESRRILIYQLAASTDGATESMITQNNTAQAATITHETYPADAAYMAGSQSVGGAVNVTETRPAQPAPQPIETGLNTDRILADIANIHSEAKS